MILLFNWNVQEQNKSWDEPNPSTPSHHALSNLAALAKLDEFQVGILVGKQSCESKSIEFGSESWMLVQIGSGSRLLSSILKEKFKNCFN